MKHATQLHIAEPCSQDWSGMTPDANGRFCGSCQKTVIDFTQMSDAEVLATLKKAAGSVCGRFETQQLQRPLINASMHRVPFRWPLLSAAVLAGFIILGSSQLHAQQGKVAAAVTHTAGAPVAQPVQTHSDTALRPSPALEQPPPVVPEAVLMGDTIAAPVMGSVVSRAPTTVPVSGCVKNQQHQTLAGVMVEWGKDATATTDAHGNFHIDVPVASLYTVAGLTILSPDYESKTVKLNKKKPRAFLNVVLDNRPLMMGLVLPPSPPRPPKK